MKLPVKSLVRAILATSLLSLALAACGDNTNTAVSTTAAATTAVPAATTAVATTVAATTSAATTAAAATAAVTTAGATTPAVTTVAATTSAAEAETGQASAKSIQALTDLGKNLDDTKDALGKNDLAAAKAAYKKFDDGWIAAEVYVQQFSRTLYQELEDAMTPVGRELLRNANTTVATVTPLFQTLTEKYGAGLKSMIAAANTAGIVPASKAISGAEVDAATAKVDTYLKGESDKLVTNATAFVTAVKARDLAKAKATYQQARYNYEAIEFLAEAFTDLDVAIDARPDDFPQGEADPTWTGFHPLEKAIWADTKLDATTDKLADKLIADVMTLRDEIKTMTIEPGSAITGAAELIEEIQSGKITGEEERYGHTDFNDFKANLVSARFVYEAYAPFIKERDAALDTEVRAAFTDVETGLVPYFAVDGTAVDYSKLDDAARKALAQKVEALADSFSKVNGTLGLNS